MGILDKTTVEVQRDMDEGLDNDPATTVGYDDALGAISAATVGATAPSVYDFTVGAVTYRTTEFNVNDTTTLLIQTSHRVKLNTPLEFHFHYAPEGDGTGDKFKFQVDVAAAGIDGTFANVTGSPFTVEHTMTGDESGDHNYIDVCDIPSSNTTVSSLYLIKITRIAASADEYAGGILLFYADAHAQNDQNRGSRQEAVK